MSLSVSGASLHTKPAPVTVKGKSRSTGPAPASVARASLPKPKVSSSIRPTGGAVGSKSKSTGAAAVTPSAKTTAGAGTTAARSKAKTDTPSLTVAGAVKTRSEPSKAATTSSPAMATKRAGSGSVATASTAGDSLGSSTSEGGPQPTSMKRGKTWNEEVEDAYRFQLAGFRDNTEYVHFHNGQEPDRWPNGLVKVLKLKNGCFYCYNRARECADKDIHRTKLYAY